MDSKKASRNHIRDEKIREDDRNHFLVLGAPRSGTTLLSSVLGFHPGIRMMVECASHEHRQQIGGQAVGNKLCVPNQITLDPESPSILEYAERFARWILDRPHDPMTIRVYVEEWDAQLIPIVRSPDHVVHSMSKRGKTKETAKRQWAEAVTIIDRLCENYPQRTHLLHFRTLVTSPESVARELCAFIGVEYDARMLDGHGGAPWAYNKGKIDPSVATKSVPDSNIEQSHPEAAQTYTELVELTNREDVTSGGT